MQDLSDFYISSGYQPVLDMLNVKYFIFEGEKNTEIQKNERALGNAWFVNKVSKVNSANEEILGLKTVDLSNTAIVNGVNPLSSTEFKTDSLATIKLTSHKPTLQVFNSSNSNKSFAVFSEMFYKKGWIAHIDGNQTPIVKTNYALRGLEIPAGDHEIVFEFKPQVIKTGSTITLIAFVVLLILLSGGLVYTYKKQLN